MYTCVSGSSVKISVHSDGGGAYLCVYVCSCAYPLLGLYSESVYALHVYVYEYVCASRIHIRQERDVCIKVQLGSVCVCAKK